MKTQVAVVVLISLWGVLADKPSILRTSPSGAKLVPASHFQPAVFLFKGADPVPGSSQNDHANAGRSFTSSVKTISVPAVKKTSDSINLSRTVSVKSPKQLTGVINHFNPAGHVYEATGNVNIQRSSGISTAKSISSVQQQQTEPRQIEKTVFTKTPTDNKKPNGLSLSRTVSVKSPTRVTGVIDHFNPAGHIYEATGNVNINLGSNRQLEVKTIKQSSEGISTVKSTSSVRGPIHISRTVVAKTITDVKPQVSQKPSGLSLSRTVSVKSPTRATGVIDHFNPAGHIYEATGNVNINLGSKQTVRQPVVQKSREDISTVKSTSFVQKEPAQIKKTIITKTTSQVKPQVNQKASGLNLSRTVSVKSPKRVTGVIDHFNPAGHIYEATGNVNINLGSKQTVRQPVNSIAKEISTFQVQNQKPKPVHNTETVISPKTVSEKESGNLSLSRKVSVKSPPRLTGVIDHFNPAQHIYEASGDVNINIGQQNSAPQITKKIVTQKIAPSLNAAPTKIVRPQAIAPTTFVTQSTPKRSSKKDFKLSKSVSVSSPKRLTGVIDHFNPAGHVYKATGTVNINTGSTTSSRVQKSSFQSKPAVAALPVKVIPAPAQVSKSVVSQKIETVKQAPVQIKSQKNLSLSRTVSVKSPQKLTGVIDHFNPAVHIYEATGNVNINTGSFTKSTQQVKFNSGSNINVQRSPVTVVQKQIQPAVVETVTVQNPAISIVTKMKDSSASDLSLTRKVSVKSPQKLRGIIDHFNPAVHVYEATGEVNINTGSQKSSSSTKQESRFSQEQSQGSSNLNQQRTKQQTIVSAPKVLTVTTTKQASGNANQNQGSGSFNSKNVATLNLDDSSEAQSFQTGHQANSISLSAASSQSSGSQSSFQKSSQTTRKSSGSFSSSDLLRELQEFRADAVQSKKGLIRTNFDDSGEVMVSRRDSGVELKPVVSNIFAPAHRFSNQGLRHFSQFAVSGVNNQRNTDHLVSDQENNASIKFATSFSNAMKETGGASVQHAKAMAEENMKRSHNLRLNGQSSGKSIINAIIIDESRDTHPHFKATDNVFQNIGMVSQPIVRTLSKSVVSNQGNINVADQSASTAQAQSSSSLSQSGSSTSQGGNVVFVQSSGSQNIFDNSGENSGFSLNRKVSIKTPERSSGVISHFTPDEHVFDASGEVNINLESKSSSANTGRANLVQQQANSVQSSSQNFESSSQNVQKSGGFDLNRKVTVKSPKRVSGVISHFTPADHIYDAVGEVTISKTVTNPAKSVSTSSNSQQSSAKINVIQNTNRNNVKTIVLQPTKSNDRFELNRKVTIKTPERNSGVISFFTPADHRYEATGEVNIVKQSSRGSQRSSNTQRQESTLSSADLNAGGNAKVVTTTKTISQAVPSFISQEPEPVVAKSVSQSPVKPISRPSSRGSIQEVKKVVVNTPLIDHGTHPFFVPAGHTYKAESTVVIDRDSN